MHGDGLAGRHAFSAGEQAVTEDEDKATCPECFIEYVELQIVEFIGWNGMCPRCFLEQSDGR